MKPKWIATLTLSLLPLVASADQMVIDGNVIRDGDPIGVLIKYAGEPLTVRYETVCLNKDCTAIGDLERWIYIHDNIQYTVGVFRDRVTSIKWVHAR